MPKATYTPTTGAVPSRRQILGGATLAAMTGAAVGLAFVLPDPGEASPAPAGPDDAELIGLCAECDALQRQVDALYVRPAEPLSYAAELFWEAARDLDIHPILDRMDPLLDRICDLRATTPQGHAARARTLLLWDKDPCWKDDGCWNSQLIGAIVRDLVGEA